MGVFVGDATVTLVRRLLRGERVYQAHCSHAYQRAVQAGRSHAAVSRAVLVLNACLAVLAAIGWSRPVLLPATLAAAAVLVGVAYVSVERVRPFRYSSPPAAD